MRELLNKRPSLAVIATIVLGAFSFFAGATLCSNSPLVFGNENTVSVHQPAVAICPNNWADKSGTGEDHVPMLACEKDGWLVVLNIDGSFNQSLHLDTPGADWINTPEASGWPR